MRILTTFMVLVCFSLSAQQVDPILFTEKTYDFGEIAEGGGPAEHEFSFTNNTGRAIRILSVQASCGCTTPGWTKDPIQPGKSAFVKASFDPKGRPGYFNKSLTVVTDFDATTISLQIKGQVIGRQSEAGPTGYSVESGNLRLKYNTFSLGKLFINRLPTPKEFKIYNAGNQTIHFAKKILGPAYIKVITPDSLMPKWEGILSVTYDPKLRNQYGFVSDNVELETDDTLQPVKSFSVYATIEELFPTLTAEELANAPVLRIDVNSLDIGRMRQGNIMAREFVLRNMGKKELVIRALQGNCSCLTGKMESMKIKPGGEGKLVITLNTEGRTGIQQKALTIYSNDPKNPVQRITMSGYIEGQ